MPAGYAAARAASSRRVRDRNARPSGRRTAPGEQRRGARRSARGASRSCERPIGTAATPAAAPLGVARERGDARSAGTWAEAWASSRPSRPIRATWPALCGRHAGEEAPAARGKQRCASGSRHRGAGGARRRSRAELAPDPRRRPPGVHVGCAGSASVGRHPHGRGPRGEVRYAAQDHRAGRLRTRRRAPRQASAGRTVDRCGAPPRPSRPRRSRRPRPRPSAPTLPGTQLVARRCRARSRPRRADPGARPARVSALRHEARPRRLVARARVPTIPRVAPWRAHATAPSAGNGRAVFAAARVAGERASDLDGDLGDLGRRPADAHAVRLERLLLGRRGARRARDDRAGVAHRLAGRRGEAGDVGDDGLGHVLGDVLGGLLLGVAADLAAMTISSVSGSASNAAMMSMKRRAGDRVAADADDRRVAEAALGELVADLVGQRARARDDADVALLEERRRDDPDVGLAGREHARAVRPDQAHAVGARRGGCRRAARRGRGCPR